MKLIQEANIDDAFNRHMSKIQDAISALEKLEQKMDQPVSSQPRMLDVAAEDLTKLSKKLAEKRGARGQK